MKIFMSILSILLKNISDLFSGRAESKTTSHPATNNRAANNGMPPPAAPTSAPPIAANNGVTNANIVKQYTMNYFDPGEKFQQKSGWEPLTKTVC